MNPVRRTVLEQKAKQIEKLKGLKWSKALDEAAKEYGFSNLRHYQNVTKKLSPKQNLDKAVTDFKSFSELRVFLKSLKPSEINFACIKFGFKDHVELYLQDLSSKGYLNPGGFIPNSSQKLEFEFYDFNFQVDENYIGITGNFLVLVKSLLDKNVKLRSAVIRSDRFEGKFLARLDSDKVISLENVEISDKSFWAKE